MSKGFFNLLHTKIGIYHGPAKRRGDKSQSVGEVVRHVKSYIQSATRCRHPTRQLRQGRRAMLVVGDAVRGVLAATQGYRL